MRVVPPPVPPRSGLTERIVGVRADLYMNVEFLTTELTVTNTVQVESTRGVEEAGVYDLKKKNSK